MLPLKIFLFFEAPHYIFFTHIAIMNRISITPSVWLVHLPQWAQELLQSPLFYRTICIVLGTSPLWAPGLLNLTPFRGVRIWVFAWTRSLRPTLSVFRFSSRAPLVEQNEAIPTPVPGVGPEEDPLAHIPDMEDDDDEDSLPPTDREIVHEGYTIMDPREIANVNSAYGSDFSQVPRIRLSTDEYPTIPWIWDGYESPEAELTEDDDSDYYEPELPQNAFRQTYDMLSNWLSPEAVIARDQRRAAIDAQLSRLGITGILVENPNGVVEGDVEDSRTMDCIAGEHSLPASSGSDSSAVSERLLVSTLAENLSDFASSEDSHANEDEANGPITEQLVPAPAPGTQGMFPADVDLSCIDDPFSYICGFADGPDGARNN
ncbi:hypothetical protein N7456_002955 [Penicillium angulare]|uniref:Uncharacterized protein n=1 Tax=Penicillium angulare TaxID=116970 RepID=A0A9W9FUD6_9EURO|nr:hypothetical protein N7456_002955 [Penicillium angulare]